MNHRSSLALGVLGLLGLGCPTPRANDSGSPTDDTDTPTPSLEEDWSGDMQWTDLVVDMAAMQGTATITVTAAETTNLSLDVAGLELLEVEGMGGDLDWALSDGRLDVALPPGDPEPQVVVSYAFEPQAVFEGWMDTGSTLTWPYYCGNLFPCQPHPEDGLGFSLDIRGIDDGLIAIYPDTIPSDAPAYQPAWAVGDYTALELGSTDGGVQITIWYLPGGREDAQEGGEHLRQAFEWFEDTLGPYTFGDRAGTVAVDWGGGAYGGMEHHPYSHIASGAIADRETQIHEAAHGWYGDGIRIACWEDLVLSEGTATYLTVRAIEEVIGPEAALETWGDYASYLDYAVANETIETWPDSCELDVLEDDLFSYAPYFKGAYFYKALADEIGVEVLDASLGSFYQRWVGQAAGMQDFIDHVWDETGYDAMPLAEAWLRSFGIPE